MNLELIQISKPNYVINTTDEIPEPDKNDFDFEETFLTVCEIFKQHPDRVIKSGKRRFREYLIIKQTTMALARLKSKMTLSDIGDKFGRDHATVSWSLRVIKNLLDTDNEYRKTVGHLFEGLKFPHFKN